MMKNPPFYKKLRFKLFIMTFLIEGVMLTILLYNGQRIINHHLVKQANNKLSELESSFNIALAGSLLSRDYASLQSITDGWVGLKQFKYVFIEKEGRILVASSWDKTQKIPEQSRDFSGEDNIYHGIFMMKYEGQKLGNLHFGIDTSFLRDAKQELLTQGAIIAFLELLASGILLFSIGIWLTNHLLNLTEASQKISEGDFDIEVSVATDDEVALLANSFNKMSIAIKKREYELKTLNENLKKIIEEEIEKARKKDEILYEQIRKNSMMELLVNIAHQWRQPLNVVSLELDNIEYLTTQKISEDDDEIRQSIDKVSNQLNEISSLITFFTDIYEGTELTLKELPLVELVDSSFEVFNKNHNGHSLALENSVEQNIRVLSDKNVFSQIFLPLLQNSFDAAKEKHIDTPVVKVKAQTNGDTVNVIIEDNCGGIKAEILKTVFDPYSTTSFRYKNKGLGLFAVKNIIEHKLKGTIQAQNIKGGTRLVLTLKSNLL